MTTQLSRDHLGLPPPLEVDLIDADRRVGWITGNAVGFRGFADETEAAHAAWIAYRALARRLARPPHTRPIPVGSVALAIARRGADDVILADGRPIATLLRPAPAGRTGPDSFGFEVRVPLPADEIRVQGMAYLMYRTLRKSGIRWALWRPAGRPTRRRRDRARRLQER